MLSAPGGLTLVERRLRAGTAAGGVAGPAGTGLPAAALPLLRSGVAASAARAGGVLGEGVEGVLSSLDRLLLESFTAVVAAGPLALLPAARPSPPTR